jgi:quercetin dioxygenase-like cupin family protein
LLVTAHPCGFESFVPRAGAPAPAYEPGMTPPPITQEDIGRLMAITPEYGIEMKMDWQTAGAPGPMKSTATDHWVLGEHVRLHLTGPDTKQQFCVAEITSRPGGGVPPHRHQREDECFYVLEGKFQFTFLDDAGSNPRSVPAPAGTFIHVPKGAYHGFSNAGPGRARMLDYHSPAGFEGFFRSAGTLCTNADAAPPPGAANPERLRAVCQEFGMELA